MKGRNQHVTKRADGKWQVKGEGARRASFVTTTQGEAIKRGRQISSNQHSELITHRPDGKSAQRIPMGTIPSRREDRGLTPLRLRAWISVSAAANACRKYAANSGTPEHNGFSA